MAYCEKFVSESRDLWVSGYGVDGFRIERYGPESEIRFRRSLQGAYDGAVPVELRRLAGDCH